MLRKLRSVCVVFICDSTQLARLQSSTLLFAAVAPRLSHLFLFPSFPSYSTFSLACDAPQWRRKKLDTQVRLLERVRDSLIGRDKVSQKIPFHHSSSFYYTLAAGGAFSLKKKRWNYSLKI